MQCSSWLSPLFERSLFQWILSIYNGPFFRGRLIMTYNSLFFQCLTDQAIQYLLAPVVKFTSAFLLAFLVCLLSFRLSLFFASLSPKFKLSRDDRFFLLNLSCHMTPVCNFPVRSTTSFNNLLEVSQLSLHQKSKNLWTFGYLFFFFFFILNIKFLHHFIVLPICYFPRQDWEAFFPSGELPRIFLAIR